MNWNNYYSDQVGGMTFFKGPSYQSGYGGLGGGSWWGRLFKWFTPLASKAFEVAKPVLKESVRAISTEGLNTAVNIAKDAISGRDVVDSAKEHATNASSNLHEKALQALNKAIKGSGKKRKGKKKNFIIISPKQKKVKFNEPPDIFENFENA